jgi:hypothetical protein
MLREGCVWRKMVEEVDLRFGNVGAVVDLLPSIGRWEGNLPDLVAEEFQRASKKVEKGSWKEVASNSKGRPTTRIDQIG